MPVSRLDVQERRTLIGVPFPQGYGDDFDREEIPLVPVTMEIYRGFIWGNLAPEGRS